MPNPDYIAAQMRRASLSVASNIAEGCSRNRRAELHHLLGCSAGSTVELEWILRLCAGVGPQEEWTEPNGLGSFE